MLVGRSASAGRWPATDEGGVQAYMIDRMPFVMGHRIELAGVSVGCLLVALLMQVGAI